MTKIDNLRDAIMESRISYQWVSFPIKHLGEGVFTTKENFNFKFALEGASYISDRNTKYKAIEFTSLFRVQAWASLESLANEAMRGSKGHGENVLLALYGGCCVGILRQYKIVHHDIIVMAIEEAGLAGDISRWQISSLYMFCDITRPTIVGDTDDFVFGLRIINGHSGHHALRYNLLIKALGYEFSTPLYGYSRHVSGVEKIVTQLKGTLDEIGEIKIDIRLKDMTAFDIVSMINASSPAKTMRQETLMHIVSNLDLETALDVVVALGQYATTKGYSKAVSTLLDPVMKKLLLV